MTGPITYGTTGLLFGGMVPESGVILISIDISTAAQSKEVLDQYGNIVGIGTYAFKKDYKINTTFLSPATGIAALSIGTEVALANLNNNNGISGGHIILKNTNLRYSNEDFVKYDLSATQYPYI